MATHRIKWFVYAGDERIPKTARMRGTWGCDVECSCGWKTSTGGATQHYIRVEVQVHKFVEGLK